MEVATQRADVFTKEAVAVIYEQSKGISRLINAVISVSLPARRASLADR